MDYMRDEPREPLGAAGPLGLLEPPSAHPPAPCSGSPWPSEARPRSRFGAVSASEAGLHHVRTIACGLLVSHLGLGSMKHSRA